MKVDARALVLPALGVGLAGALLLLADHASPRRFELMTSEQVVQQISSHVPDEISPAERAFIAELLRHNGKTYVGKIMYPRYSARHANGELFFLNTDQTVEYPLLTFSLIGPSGLRNVRFPGGPPGDIVHYSDAIVIGCFGHGRVDAALIVQTAPVVHVYARTPLPAATCPLPEPVCDANGICR